MPELLVDFITSLDAVLVVVEPHQGTLHVARGSGHHAAEPDVAPAGEQRDPDMFTVVGDPDRDPVVGGLLAGQSRSNAATKASAATSARRSTAPYAMKVDTPSPYRLGGVWRGTGDRALQGRRRTDPVSPSQSQTTASGLPGSACTPPPGPVRAVPRKCQPAEHPYTSA